MISSDDLEEIKPKVPTEAYSSQHVHFGIPIPKITRVQTFSPEQWEEFVEEWATSLGDSYIEVRRYGGAGDLGVDVAGFVSEARFQGEWDNYQCKRYDHPLRPSDIWVEIGKIVYYAFCGEYVFPRKYFFVCPQGVGTKLEKLLGDPEKLKIEAQSNWDQHSRSGITSTTDIPLEGSLLEFFEGCDFSVFGSKSGLELIKGHEATGYHAVRFGGGFGPRASPEVPPAQPRAHESRYIRQLLDAYGEHMGKELKSPKELKTHGSLSRDYLRQRVRFYHAESLETFARDNVPDGIYLELQDEVYHGVVDVCESPYTNGLERMRATLVQATRITMTANPLALETKIQDRMGICHHLANIDRLTWVVDLD